MPNWVITILAFLLGMASWGGLAYLVTYYVPDSTSVALSLFLVFIAITGTVMPVVHVLNYRFGLKTAADGRGVTDRWQIWRQSSLVGLLVVIGLWFQLLRVLSPIVVVLLVGVFVLVEMFFRTRAD
jgi:hypothetical protein